MIHVKRGPNTLVCINSGVSLRLTLETPTCDDAITSYVVVRQLLRHFTPRYERYCAGDSDIHERSVAQFAGASRSSKAKQVGLRPLDSK